MIYIRTLCNLDLSLSLSCRGTCFSQDKQIMCAFSLSCRDRTRNETTRVECKLTGRDQWGKTAVVDIFFVIDTLLQCCPSPWSTKIWESAGMPSCQTWDHTCYMVCIKEFWCSRWGAFIPGLPLQCAIKANWRFFWWVPLLAFPYSIISSNEFLEQEMGAWISQFYMGGQQMVSNCFSYGIPCLVFLRYLTGPVLLIHINLCTWPISAVIKDVDSVYYLESLAISHLVRNFPFSWVSLFDEWLAEPTVQTWKHLWFPQTFHNSGFLFCGLMAVHSSGLFLPRRNKYTRVTNPCCCNVCSSND
jgi:hypothetical protein